MKFRDDAALLENALRSETDPFLVSRYTFYLAQSYRDCGDKAQALPVYLRRSQQGFWQQEIVVSLYNAACIKEELGHAHAEVVQAYLDAYESCPTRAEALHGAVRLCRLHNKFQQGYILWATTRSMCPTLRTACSWNNGFTITACSMNFPSRRIRRDIIGNASTPV